MQNKDIPNSKALMFGLILGLILFAAAGYNLNAQYQLGRTNLMITGLVILLGTAIYTCSFLFT